MGLRWVVTDFLKSLHLSWEFLIDRDNPVSNASTRTSLSPSSFFPLLLQGAHEPPWLLRYTTKLSNVVTFLREIWVPEPLHPTPHSSQSSAYPQLDKTPQQQWLFCFRHTIVLNRMKEKDKKIKSNLLILLPRILLEEHILCRYNQTSHSKLWGENVGHLKAIPVILFGSRHVHLLNSVENKVKC